MRGVDQAPVGIWQMDLDHPSKQEVDLSLDQDELSNFTLPYRPPRKWEPLGEPASLRLNFTTWAETEHNWPTYNPVGAIRAEKRR